MTDRKPIENRYDFTILFDVKDGNPNGDPDSGNMPRVDIETGNGLTTDVCIKRKIRNRMQDLDKAIFVQSDDRCTDGYKSLSERAAAATRGIKEQDEYVHVVCEKWMDVRSFGQVFAFKGDKSGVSGGVRGPVSIHQAVSVSPVEVDSMQITKSVNSEPGDKKGSDTMGTKHFVRFGLYKLKGSINVQLAEKTGFSREDADVIDPGTARTSLPTASASSAVEKVPEGSPASTMSVAAERLAMRRFLARKAYGTGGNVQSRSETTAPPPSMIDWKSAAFSAG